MQPPPWVENTQLGALRADDLTHPDYVFRYGRYFFRTLGTHLAAGGMGTVSEMERRLDNAGPVEQVCGKTFQVSYLNQRFYRVDVPFPVGGTLITSNGLCGKWRITAHLDGADDACGAAAQIVITE